MCGIAGYKTYTKINPKILSNMVSILKHRGPNSVGYYNSELYNAGMRRLSINDVNGGDQPLFNEDKSIVLLYNGEIYNYYKLRKKLEQKGHCFSTKSDGEVICHLYEEFKESLFEQLDGMFALSLWIKKERKLILARDIAGEKPLYYSLLSDTELVFASELKSIMQFPQISNELDYQSLWDFPTFLWIPEPKTVYKNVSALPKKHILIANDENIKIISYQNKFGLNITLQNEKSIISTVRNVVDNAVESRLLSDVPVGSFLSSGLDSSIIASIAVKKLPKLSTFTIGFENIDDPYHGKADESVLAKQFADKIGSKHYNVKVNAEDFKEDLKIFCKYGDQPFSVSSGLGILAIARVARDLGIKVLLSGDGADECFGGYSWYEYLNYSNSGEINNDNSNISMQNVNLNRNRILKILSKYSPQKRAWAWHYYASEKDKKKLFNMDIFNDTESSLRYFYSFNNNIYWESEDFIRQDREFYFPNEMLRKVDRMTMAFSVEGRAPFASASVLNLAKKLSFSELVKNKILKYVLREAYKDILPIEIINRSKHGFNVPIDHWLRNEWFDLFEKTFESESTLVKYKIIDKDSYKNASNMLRAKDRLNGHTIFSFIILNLWLEEQYG